MPASGPGRRAVLCAALVAAAGIAGAQPADDEQAMAVQVAEQFAQAIQEDDLAAAVALMAPLDDGTRITRAELSRFLATWPGKGLLPRYRAEEVGPGDDGVLVSLVPKWEPLKLVIVQVGDEYLVDVERSLQAATGMTPEQLAAARGQVSREVCQSNLKQLAMAVLMYAADWDGQLPALGEWTDRINPYMRNDELLRCPSDPVADCSYAFNAALEGLALKDIPAPGETILLFEAKVGERNVAGGAAEAAAHHGDVVYVAFADGHVAGLPNVTPEMFLPPGGP